MKGMNIEDFINKVYCGDEMEFIIDDTTYFVQGSKAGDKYELTVDYWKNIDGTEPLHDYLFSITCASLQERLKQFEEAAIFEGKTIYEVERDITVLYG